MSLLNLTDAPSLLLSFSPARIAFLFLVFGLASCEPDALAPKGTTEGGARSASLVIDDDGDVSPYNVAVMRAAAQSLNNEGWSLNFIPDTTDVYVAFDIAKDSMYDQLADDATITLFSHPLWDYTTDAEYEAAEVDPNDTVGTTLPHTFYAVISANAELPEGSRVLEYVHIPERQSSLSQFVSPEAKVSEYIDAIEGAAFKIVGADNPFRGDDGEVFERADCWTAEGTLTVDETIRPTQFSFTNLGPTGLCGAKVILWRGLRTESAYTGCGGTAMGAGRFRINCVRKERNWRVEFKTENELKVVNEFGIAHEFKRPGDKTKSFWGHNFPWWNTDWMHATLVNGASQYDRFRGTHSMASPWHTFQLINVRAVYGEGTNRHSPWPLTNRLKLWSERPGGLRKGTDNLQRTLAHELTHSAHYKAGQYHMLTTKDLVSESYADFAEWLFCQRFYPHQSTEWGANKQLESFSQMDNGYTSVFIDLIDNNNQCQAFGNGPLCQDRPNDQVNSYADPVWGGWIIQNAVFVNKNINDVGNHLINGFPSNPQNINVPALIAGFDAIQ